VEIRARVGNLTGEFALEDRMAGEGRLKLFAGESSLSPLDAGAPHATSKHHSKLKC
jgi:hypothetical protein